MSHRTALLVAVLACHALLAWLLTHAFGLNRPPVALEPTLTYLWLPSQPGTAPATIQRAAPGGKLPRRAPTAPAAPPRARDADPDFAGPITLPPANWRGASEDAARAVLRGQEEAARRAARLDGPARPPPQAMPRDRALPWTETSRQLIPKNGLLDISVNRHGVDLTLFDHCVIHDLLAFGCRLGPPPEGRSDLFDGMKEQLDRRTTAPLP
jgi:hypothetical protein